MDVRSAHLSSVQQESGIYNFKLSGAVQPRSLEGTKFQYRKILVWCVSFHERHVFNSTRRKKYMFNREARKGRNFSTGKFWSGVFPFTKGTSLILLGEKKYMWCGSFGCKTKLTYLMLHFPSTRGEKSQLPPLFLNNISRRERDIN